MDNDKKQLTIWRAVAIIALCALVVVSVVTVSGITKPAQTQPAASTVQATTASSQTAENKSAPCRDKLKSWTDSAVPKEEFVKYMESITDPNSADFIPVEDRIAVFDVDGTLICETDPGYFDHMLLYHRVMEDPDYKDKATDTEKEAAAKCKEYFETRKYPSGLDVLHGTAIATSFEGMTIDEFYKYVQDYAQTTSNSYDGMNKGQAFYKPMEEIIDCLLANDFKVYLVSGTDRLIVRAMYQNYKLNIPSQQIIGSDELLVATGQGDKDGLEYMFTKQDKVVMGGKFIQKNLKMNKVTAINREIGKQPVLSFGNSSGDYSMAQFVITNNKYKNMAVMLCWDDLERENGKLDAAQSMQEACQKNGWIPVSMKNDWKTIYGEGVTKKN